MLRKVFVLLFKTLFECKASISHLILRTKAASGRLTSNTLTLMSTRVAVSRKGSTKTIPGLETEISIIHVKDTMGNEYCQRHSRPRGNFFKVKTQVLAPILIKIWFWKWKYRLWISKTRPGPRWVASSKVVPHTTSLSYWHTWDNQSFHIRQYQFIFQSMFYVSELPQTWMYRNRKLPIRVLAPTQSVWVTFVIPGVSQRTRRRGRWWRQRRLPGHAECLSSATWVEFWDFFRVSDISNIVTSEMKPT